MIVAKRMYGALEAGQVVNPGFVESQITGMLVQAASRMLKEEVTFSRTNVTSLDWVSYPILRCAAKRPRSCRSSSSGRISRQPEWAKK